MVAGIRFRKAWETPGAKPVKLTRVNDDTTNRVAMTANKLGSRMHHDISAMGDWIDNSRTCGCVVNDQWQTILVGDFCNSRDINRVKLWIPNGLRINRLGVWLNRSILGRINLRKISSKFLKFQMQ